LLVENGGQVVNSGGGYVGFIGGSNGFATVDGVGSIWDSQFFQVGGSGAALMTIRNGATAISRLTGANSVSLGEQVSGNGTVRVQSGASWVNQGSMVIGTKGTAR
jgi:T5SS/PEP-CTERM-associated repeat protein